MIVVLRPFSGLALELAVVILYCWAVAILFGDGARCDLSDAQTSRLVSVHNRFRQEVVPAACPPLPPVQWSKLLANVAQAYANKCIYNHNAQRTREAKGRFSYIGENLYISTGTQADMTQVVSSWNSENRFYSLRTNSCMAGKVCGHYTQVVWSSSTSIGCGAAVCDTKNMSSSPWPSSRFPKVYIVVCNYGPGGNIVGRKPYTEAVCEKRTAPLACLR